MSRDPISVVVTGLGAVTPVGADTASTWSAILAGKSGVAPLTADWALDLPVRIAAPVLVDPAGLLEPAKSRKMDRCQRLALVAAREAWQHAGTPDVDPDRLGVSVSSGIGGLISTLDDYDKLKDTDWRRISPYGIPRLMANGSAGWISLELGARAGAHTVVSACASGAEAIGYGIDMIRAGRADAVLAGGADACIHQLSVASFAAMRALSTRNDEPELASRPFDKNRDGFVLGEGAGMMMLESAAHARKRGARVLAVAGGVGYASDAYHIAKTRPDGAGATRAMDRALTDAGVTPAQVLHVNAHAASTPAGDGPEALAIMRTLGSYTTQVIVSATKSMTGHLLGGAGAVESVIAVCALRERIAPPTINLDDLDQIIAKTGVIISTEPREFRESRTRAAVLNNSFGFGGHNVSLAFLESMEDAA